MTPDEIRARVGTEVDAADMADLIRSNPIGTSPNDVRVRSGTLTFTFGPGSVRLVDAEIRTPVKSPDHES